MKYFLLSMCYISFNTIYTQTPEIDWQNTIGGYNDDYLTSISPTSDGGYILGGDSYSGSNGDKNENKFGESDYWIVKLDGSGNIIWQNTIGGSSIETLKFIQQTGDGGYILGGFSLSGISGDKTESNIDGSYDYWILKLDGSGNIIWQNTIGGNQNDKANCIVQTSDGGYLVGGESESGISGDKTESSIGNDDYWLVKLDSTGNILWQNTIGGSSFDGLYSIDQTTDNGYILGGYSISGISGDKTENSIGGSYDYWVLKLDASGNIVWQNTIGGSASDKLKKIMQTSDGGFIVGGTSASDISFDKTEDSYGDDYWVLKLDASGNVVWQNTINALSADILNDLLQTSDGGYIVGGSSISLAGYDKSESRIGPSTFNDYWIIKLDLEGSIVWENTIGGNKADDFKSLQECVDGGYILAGSSLSEIYEDKIEANWNSGTYDWWVVKLFSDIEACDVPEGLFTDNITSTSAKIHWNLIPAAENYKVYYRIEGAASWIKKNAFTNFKNHLALAASTT